MTKTLLLLASSLLSLSAHAATWNPLTPTMLSGTTTYVIDGNKGKTITVSVNPGASDGYYAYREDIGSQDPTNIESQIKSEFDTGTMSLIGHCDKSCTNATLVNSNGTQDISTKGEKFDYLAIHFGNGQGVSELLFYWTVAIESVTVTGLKSFSNFRAYKSELADAVSVSAVPLPGAALMFLSALGFGAGVQRRRRAKVSVAAA